MPAISSSSALYDLVLDRNWLAVVSHCEMYPQDAAYSDPDTFGETPLYLAMNWNPPLFAVRALIKANPDAIYPQTKNRDCPIHLACRFGASLEVIRCLLEADPRTAVLNTKYGDSPLLALHKCFVANHPAVELRADYIRSDPDGTCLSFWSKVKLVLTTAYVGKVVLAPAQLSGANASCHDNYEPSPTKKLDNNHKLLHCAVGVSCPEVFQMILFELYPHEAHEPMVERGNKLPLHVALEMRLSEKRSAFIVDELLKLNPDAATKVNCEGQYPIHVALIHEITWNGGLHSLFRAAPGLIGVQDPISRFFPFQLSAFSLTTTFLLLTTEPDVIRKIMTGC
mmetsp:Transcript_4112/g.5973  ORF Transcript_4112/g.5973 Transcript_4112/m.5973 type:complete len:339 (-) Transcript_4112:138-1154(-)